MKESDYTYELLPGAQIQERVDLHIWPIIKFGDLSLSGLSDIMINLQTKEGKADVFLFENHECEPLKQAQEKEGGQQASRKFCRRFVQGDFLKKAAVVFNGHSLHSTLFDFAERGLSHQEAWHHFAAVGRWPLQAVELHQQL